MTLQTSGFTEKQSHLLQQLLKDLKEAIFKEEQFNLFKSQLISHWDNTSSSKSISQLFSYLSSTIQPNNPSSQNLSSALKNITFSQFTDFTKQIFTQVSVKSLIHGNWEINSAKEIGKLIKQFFVNSTSDEHGVLPSIINIENQGTVELPLILPKHDHSTITYYPLAEKDLLSVAKCMITSQLLSPLFFHKMRTEKQYGYLVGVNFIPINRYPGIAFYIQSPSTQSTDLSEAIDNFIMDACLNIEAMESDHWEHIKHGLSSQLLEKDSSLRIKSQRFWTSISTDECNFNQKSQLIKEIKQLTLEQIKSFLKETLCPSSHPDRINLLSFNSNEDLEDSTITKKDIKNTLYLLNNYQRKY
jgi:secreted Zn-dependent insulinase-like peptidase